MNWSPFAKAMPPLLILLSLTGCGTTTKSTGLQPGQASGFCDQDEALVPFYDDIGPPAFKARTERMYAKHLTLCGDR